MAENNSPPPLMTDKELLMETGAFNEIMNAAFEYADAYCASGDEPRRYSAAIDHLRKTVRAEIARFSRGNYAALPATDSSAGDLAGALPDGWVPCTITYEGQHPEDVAYGPKIMMDRLKKWLDRYFALKAEVQAEPVPLKGDLIESVDAWFAQNTGLGGCSDKDVAELAAIFAAPQAQPADALLRHALELAFDHIDMDSLRLSHCKDAAVIDAAMAAAQEGGRA